MRLRAPLTLALLSVVAHPCTGCECADGVLTRGEAPADHRRGGGPVGPYELGFQTCLGPACNPGGSGGAVRILTTTDPRELEAALCTPGRATILPRVGGIVDVGEVFPDGIQCDASDKTFDGRGVPYVLTGRGLRLSGSRVVVLGLTCHGIDALATHEQRRTQVGDCGNFMGCTRCVFAYGECFGTVDECFDFENRGRTNPPTENVALLYSRSLPGCGAADQTTPDCQEGRGHNRWSNCTRNCGDAYWYGNVAMGFTWRIPQIVGPSGSVGGRALVGYNAFLFRGRRSTTVDAGRDGSTGRADVIGNVYVDGPESEGAQVRSDSGGVDLFVANNVVCDHGGAACDAAQLAPGVRAVTAPSWPDLAARLPPITPAELLSEGYYRERVGPGYVTPVAEQMWAEYVAGTLIVGGGYDPASFEPDPVTWTAPEDTDADGIPDAHDETPTMTDPWHDWDSDGVPNLIEYQDGTAGAEGALRRGAR